MLDKIVKWIIFSVLVGLLPISWNILRLLTQGSEISLEILFSRGELLLIGCAISSSAIGELFISGQRLVIFKLICGGCCVLSLMIDSLWFSDISNYLLSGQTYNTGFVALGSVILFICNLVAAVGCILVSEA